MYYEIHGGMKYIEQDIFETGCELGTGSGYYVDLRFSSETIRGLLRSVAEFFDVEPDAMLIDACDEEGRLDVQLYENDEGMKATLSELKEWKEGKRRLWLADYSFRVEQVERRTVSLGSNVTHLGAM